MRVIALLASYNERRFIDPCLRHLREQGIDSYLLDDGSTDGTAEIAERWLGRGLVGIERISREEDHVFSLPDQLARKEKLARELDADWFMHIDPDEIRLPPTGRGTLAEALAETDREGYNAVNFLEFTFTPTREEPDHDHPEFQRTLRTYYPFAPKFPHHVKAWKATDDVDLVSSGGHEARFPGQVMCPQSFLMKHYLFLSVPHAIEKYVGGRAGRRKGGWRSKLLEEDVRLPSSAEMRVLEPGGELDASDPRRKHHLAEPALQRIT